MTMSPRMHWIALQASPDPVLGAVSSPAPAPVLTEPLTALGWWALQFTPKVAVLPDAVLLEVSASERLWGGRAALLRRIYTQNKPVAVTGYARAATSLVALGRLYAAQPASTAADDLPLHALTAARGHLATLTRLGCSTWGQLRALPRDGLARRFGAALLDALDQADGTRPEVYAWLTLPEVFEARLELPTPVDNAPALLFGAHRLLAQMQCWLQLRQRGVLAIELGWTLDARRHTDSQGALVLRTAQVTQDMTHLQRLLAERLAQVTLPAPAQDLRLRTLQTQAIQGRSASLLPDTKQDLDSLTQTLERLSARLGADRVLRLQMHADHRPEHRQRWVAALELSKKGAAHAGETRAGGQKHLKPSDPAWGLARGWASALLPTWLLAEPLPLTMHQQQPHYHGPLTLLAGPQRLEAGWWPQAPEPADRLASASMPASEVSAAQCSGAAGEIGAAALRDYFVARNPQATLLWIFRQRLGVAGSPDSPLAWYLHGIFA